MDGASSIANDAPMIDPYGRHVSYLRVSVTDRCDFRCVYCMAEDMTFLPKKDVLTLEELERLCTAFIPQGGAQVTPHRWRTAGTSQHHEPYSQLG